MDQAASRHDGSTREVIRQECRVVFGIRHLLQKPFEDYASVLTATDETRQQQGQTDVEISEGQIRFAVGRQLWVEAGVGLDAAIAVISRPAQPS
jgi:predicted ATPase